MIAYFYIISSIFLSMSLFFIYKVHSWVKMMNKLLSTKETEHNKNISVEDLNNIINEDIPWITSDNYKDWKKSLDVVDVTESHWRHYEMVSDDIGGIVAFEKEGYVWIKFFEGDGEQYWADDLNMMLNAFWTKSYKEALERMNTWLENNCEKDEFGYKKL